MKRISRNSRLTLHKETLRALTEADLSSAVGASGNVICNVTPNLNLTPLLTGRLNVILPTTASKSVCPFTGC